MVKQGAETWLDGLNSHYGKKLSCSILTLHTEAVPRTPWLGYGIQPVSGPLTPCTEGKTPVDTRRERVPCCKAPHRQPMHRQRRFVYQNVRNQQGFILILFSSIFTLPF